jgi:hypothetical protein
MKKSSKPQNDMTEPVIPDFPVIKTEMSFPSIRSLDEINTLIEQDYPFFYESYRKNARKKDARTFVRFEL